MIINNRTDLDNAPQEQRDRFLQRLAAGTKRWQWDGAEWQLHTMTRQLDRFELTLDDLPDVPDPPKPDYDPDERAREQLAAEIREERNRLLRETDYAVIADSPHDTTEMREYRQALRDVPQQAGFPDSVDWPKNPRESDVKTK